MSIESRIREQKEKIKEDQRELSRLQDEIRDGWRSNTIIDPVISHEAQYDEGGKIIGYADKYKSGALLVYGLTSTIRLSEPKSYVDWKKIPIEYNCVAIDEDGGCWAYCNLPGDKVIRRPDGYWGNESENGHVMKIHNTIGSPPPWDKSLIHRPGAKE
jgi:hypothetical protein